MSGNKNVFSTLGSSNHSKKERELNDYYATDPNAVRQLLESESFNALIWEPACGEGHISEVLKSAGYHVRSTDLISRNGYAQEKLNFLETFEKWSGDIITNPPYKEALEFAEKGIECLERGGKLAMLLRLQFLEGQKRRKFFDECPPKKVYVFSNRIECGKNGVFTGGSAIAYAWFIWEKGFSGHPEIEWI